MKDYKVLYLELLNEHERLKEKLANLKLFAGLVPENIQNEEIKQLFHIEKSARRKKYTKYSMPHEKIDLFMSLFRGREDVYAVSFYKKKEKRIGYSPACANKGRWGICKFPCHSCFNKAYKKLDFQAVEEHLKGNDPLNEDILGIYPLSRDGKCWLLAVVFNNKQWQQDIEAFRKTCHSVGIQVAVERLAFGEGACGWIFFAETIPASLARKLGNVLLTQTMNRHYQLKISSYDCLFPNEEDIPKDGLGSLIPLPLQGAARKNKSSIFIDEKFIPYPDQWEFLGNIKKIKPCQIKALTSGLGSVFGELREEILLHSRQPYSSPPMFSKDDFPQTIHIVYSNMLYIPKDGISSQALNKIKRLAIFLNPEYDKLQKNRLSVYQTPRMIDCSEIFQKYIAIPRGCKEVLLEILSRFGIHCHIRDLTEASRGIYVDFKGKLRVEQKRAATTMLKENTGVLSASTGFGKTIVAAYLISQRKTNTLIIVHTTVLLKQWSEALNLFLSFPSPEAPKKEGEKLKTIGSIGGGKNNPTGKVDIAIINSLYDKKEVKEIVRNYGMVIVDECHHIGAYNFERVLKKTCAKYVYGLSATPKRRDGATPIIFMQLGPIRFQTNALAQARKRKFDHFFIPRFTNFKLPSGSGNHHAGIASLLSALATDSWRNNTIINDVAKSVETGKKPLLITSRRAHVELLADAVKKRGIEVCCLLGNNNSKKKVVDLMKLKNPPEKPFVIIATGNYVGEGFDCPWVNTLFLAMPVSGEGILTQYLGRLHRDFKGKDEVVIYDYVDVHLPVFEKMYHKRIKTYSALGYRGKCNPSPSDKEGVLFDQGNFLPSLKRDVESTKQEIVIVSPFVLKKRVMEAIQMLKGALYAGVNVTILTRPSEGYPSGQHEKAKAMIEELRMAGAAVVEKSNIHQKYIIFDRSVCWYGSLNFLGYGKNAHETLMRFVNLELSEELLKILWENN